MRHSKISTNSKLNFKIQTIGELEKIPQSILFSSIIGPTGKEESCCTSGCSGP